MHIFGEDRGRTETLSSHARWMPEAGGLEVVQVSRASVLAPADVLQGGHVLLNKRAALLVVIDALAPVAVLKALAEDLGRLHLDPLLTNHELALLQHGHRVGVGLGGVEVIGRGFLVELGVVALEHHVGGRAGGRSSTRQQRRMAAGQGRERMTEAGSAARRREDEDEEPRPVTLS